MRVILDCIENSISKSSTFPVCNKAISSLTTTKTTATAAVAQFERVAVFPVEFWDKQVS